MEIAIIGGGITGLTTALAFHKLGIQSTVYEQAEQLNEIGAGVWLQPNAMHILQWLGLKDEIVRAGCVLDKMEITYPNLQPVRKINADVVSDRYGHQTVAIHRGKLQRILFEAFEKVGKVELGMAYQSHADQNQRSVIQFNQKIVEADLVIGADGIGSKVRTSIGLPSVFRNTNQICCRGIANYELPLQLKKSGKEAWGKKIRFGFSEVAPGQVFFFVVMNQEVCPKDINVKTVAQQFKGFDPLVPDLIRTTKHLHIAELSDLKRLETWHKNNTCLVGDAAHATTPNMGQGACQGIEDAYYISHILAHHKTPQHAFASFEQKRRKKVDYVVNNSWKFGRMAHTPFSQSLLRTILKMTPERVMKKQMEQLYAVEEF